MGLKEKKCKTKKERMKKHFQTLPRFRIESENFIIWQHDISTSEFNRPPK